MAARKYRLTYQPTEGMEAQWIKTLDELLVPNGSEPLLVWLLKECDERGLDFKLEVEK